jgi:hypothetical protein
MAGFPFLDSILKRSDDLLAIQQENGALEDSDLWVGKSDD